MVWYDYPPRARAIPRECDFDSAWNYRTRRSLRAGRYFTADAVMRINALSAEERRAWILQRTLYADPRCRIHPVLRKEP